ncbi:hypothetical protein FA15DRAFT_707258 [Coprinopsis marcescibilis]|uniref:DUF6533 domain-containing protein n=1 Tax=Coprinopsis marcescibilis TaxID=230819 RepID=A0A5C3KMX3_COPMA|nr:hypothetical protein FA15DRAFT_707258 [Coprinopsis marcescibilis]
MELPPIDVLVADKQFATYLQVGIATVLVIDYIGTIHLEIRHVWSAPWSPIKALFLLARYSAFLDVAFIVRYNLISKADLSAETCRLFHSLGVATVLVTVALAEGVLFIRVYALSARNKVLMACLMTQFVLVHAGEFALMSVLIKTTGFDIIPGIADFIGCTPLPPPNSSMILRLIFGLLVLNATVLVMLMCWLGIRRFRNTRVSNLVAVFFRDGLGYFLVIASIAVVNIIANSRITASNFILAESQGVFHAILACRLVLHLREVGSQTETEVRGGRGKDDDHFNIIALRSTQPHRFPLIEITKTQITETYRQ